ncbi:hypothetical protein [Nitrosopumilus sp.]|uniref:hypothetical protein n=1 Tax=Nitrosopumilus sp. TaxID=2024843 RepID=UPI00349FE225
MNSSCYNCKKSIGKIQRRGTIKDIIRSGYKHPEGMLDTDNLCQECCDEIRRTQTQGQKMNERVSLAWQIVLCLIFSPAAFWRINKLQKFLIYFLIIIFGVTPLIIVLGFVFEESNRMYFLFGGYLFMYVAGHIFPLVWIINWTREYNKNSI